MLKIRIQWLKYMLAVYSQAHCLFSLHFAFYMFYENCKQHYRRLNATFSINGPVLGTFISLTLFKKYNIIPHKKPHT